MNLQKTIFVTGAGGMLGLDVVRRFGSAGFNVLAGIHTAKSENPIIPNVEWIKADITKPIFDIFKDKKIDAIIHCAAYTDVSKAETEKEKCYRVNVDGTRNVRNLARLHGAHFIYISTPFVFEGYDGDYKEDDCPLPLNFYANTKLIGEEIAKDYENSLIVRTSPIGERSIGQLANFVQWFVDMAKNNGSFTLFTDVRLNLLHTSTLANLLLNTLERKEKGILHFSSKDIVNKAEIWNTIVAKFPNFSGKVLRRSVDDTEAGKMAKRPKEMWLNVEKAIALGYELPSWKDEVEKMEIL